MFTNVYNGYSLFIKQWCGWPVGAPSADPGGRNTEAQAGRFEKSWLMDGPRRVEEAMLMEDRLGVGVVSWQQDGLESTGRVVGPCSWPLTL